MSRSTDTLTKSNVTDYKKMVSNGSIDSMEKSVISESSYDLYDTKNQTTSTVATEMPSTPTTPGYNDMLNAKYQEYAAAKTSPKKANPSTSNETKVYGLPEFNIQSQGFELAYRNEGFRDNSTYGANTRANSISNYLNEDTPIIHQVDTTEPSDANSDYYGNSSTLPMRHRGDQLSFLSELKHKLPEYEKLPTPYQQPAQSSFLPAPPDPPYQMPSTSSSRGYTKQVNSPTKPEYQQPEIRRPPPPYIAPTRSTPPPPLPKTDPRRPESYFAAMRSARHSKPPSPPPSPPVKSSFNSPSSKRPKAVYEAADVPRKMSDDRRATYSRSKSEALLETNFDDEDASQPTPLTSDSRSYSQPLETAM